MNLPFFIAKRVAFTKGPSFSRFIIRLSMFATALSVAAMILALAFVNGFQQVISEKVFSFWGHIRVQHYEPFKVSIAEEIPISRNDTVVNEIKKNNSVQFVQAFATKSAILRGTKANEGVLFKGLDKTYDFNSINRFLTKGRWMNMPDSGYSDEIVISEFFADQLGLEINQKIIIYFIQPGGEKPRIRPLLVSGIYKTGIDVYDKTFIMGDLRLIQRLNDWAPEQIGGYEVVLKDYSAMYLVSNQIYEILPQGWDSRTMQEIYPEIFDWLNLQDTNKVVLIAVMIAVAVVNLITCLLILVLERTRMVGVLKALGASDGSIQRIFVTHGAIIALTGVIIGLFIGLGICWLQKKTGFIKLNEEAYYMAVAPVNIIWWQVIAVVTGTFMVSFSILFIPSLISKRIMPVKAIEFR
ncbi:MAG: FtsX-like permease family protein [Chitinophagaceae bacterium]|nr:FtsX-like permease family protein [Chitinophagaceae bacterium]